MAITTLQDTVRHTQTIATDTWVITHNLNTTAPIVDCWVDNNGEKTKIIPSAVTATSVNVVTLSFSSARVGSAVIV